MLQKKVVIDTSGFFASGGGLRSLAEEGAVLSTPDLVVFEFAKVVREEMSRADSSGNSRRVRILLSLEERFPRLLRTLEVDLFSSEFSIDDVDSLYAGVAKGHEPGDVMIWLKMQKEGLDTIATADIKDWEALGAKVIALA